MSHTLNGVLVFHCPSFVQGMSLHCPDENTESCVQKSPFRWTQAFNGQKITVRFCIAVSMALHRATL